MSQSNEIAPGPRQRIADALENGHPLDWQERFPEKGAKGVAAADKGEFATAAAIDRIRNKHRASRWTPP